jgi:hypothetical protein
LQDLQLQDMAAGSGSPDRACAIHHRTDELLVEQHTVPDGQTASSVGEGLRTPNLWAFFLVDMRLPGKPCAYGDTKIAGSFNPFFWLTEKLHRPGLLDAPRGLNKEHRGAVWDVDSKPLVPYPELRSTKTGI